MDGALQKLIEAGDEAAAVVLAEPGLHWPHRPFWVCDACGEDWPCTKLCTHLLFTTDRRDIDLAMGSHAPNAARELGLEPRQVHARFFAWHRHEGVRRPPGGPW